MVIAIGLSTRELPISWLIRKLSKSRESHAWVYVNPTDSIATAVVYEASFFGFRKAPWAEFKASNQIINMFYSHVDLSDGIPLLDSWIGYGYDFDELIGDFWVVIGRWLNRTFHNPFSPDQHSLDCIQSVVLLLQHCHYPGAQDIIPGEATPLDLEALLKFERQMEVP